MSRDKKIELRRAELIAKIFLIGSGFTEIVPDIDDNYDFIAKDSASGGAKIGVEVRPVKSGKSGILKKFQPELDKMSPNGMPVVHFFINADETDGFFEIVGRKVPRQLLPLEQQVFVQTMKAELN
jgi:hypothetical protein